MEQALESRISSRLAVIYEEMIYADMIDSALARALPALLRSYRIRQAADGPLQDLPPFLVKLLCGRLFAGCQKEHGLIRLHLKARGDLL